MPTPVLEHRTIRVRRPTAPSERPTATPTPAESRGVKSLQGLRVGLRTEGQWMSWIAIVQRWSERLRTDGAIPDVLTTNPYKLGDELKAEKLRVSRWAQGLDIGISGLGTCGSCTAYTVTDGVAIAQAGKPALLAITEAFVEHARSIGNHLGYPQLQILELPHPLEGRSDEELAQIADAFYPKFLEIAGLKA